MANFTLTNGASTKVVDSVVQKDELVRMGWTVASGSAHDTNLPFNDHTKVTNPTKGDFAGVGRAGEVAGTIAEDMLKATEGASQEEYEAFMNIYRGSLAGVAKPTGLKATVVSKIPTLDADEYAKSLYYILTQPDKISTTSYAPGVYTIVRSSESNAYVYTWTAYTGA